MPKPYSLDFTIVSSHDRCQAVANILASLEYLPSQTDLEQMADYILYGRDDDHLSLVDTHDILSPERKHNSYRTKDDRNVSYEAKLELAGPAAEEEISRPKVRYKVARPEIRRPVYDSDGRMLSPGDSLVPGMADLWARIDAMAKRVDMYKGKIAPNDYVLAHPITSYQLYKLNHWLIDLRRHQYYLKDAYNPTLHFNGYTPPVPGRPALCAETDTGIWLDEAAWLRRKVNPKPYDIPQPSIEDVRRDGEGRLYWKLSSNHINDENPTHVHALLMNYAALLKHCYDQPDSDARAVCWDVERQVEAANLTDVEQFVLEMMVAHKQANQVQELLADDGVALSLRQVQHLMRHVIPVKLARAAARLRVESQAARGEIGMLRCTGCGCVLPKHPIFFYRSADKRTGFCSQCKDCQKAKRRRYAK